MSTVAASIGLPRMGFGLMQLTWKPEPATDEQAFETIKLAIDAGCTFLNSGEFYGIKPPEANLELLSRFYAKYPEYVDKTFLSVKGALSFENLQPDASTEGLRRSVTNINAKLGGKKKMDLFECARVDQSRPIEEVMKDLKDLRDEGHFKHVGLSECSADTIRRAAKIVDISVVEVEYSLWSTDIERNGIYDTCNELGIPIAAYSPLGRGFLTGSLKKEDLKPGDFRGSLDRFQDEAWEHNMQLVEKVKAIASKKGVSNAQLALAWVMARGIIPLFGSTRPTTARDSLQALNLKLTEQDMKEIRDVIEATPVQGGRYNQQMEGSLAA